MSIGREWKELRRFESLSQSARSIVFYAENKSSIVHFEPIINELTKNMCKEICYVTSILNDPILNTNNMIHSFYIGNGTARTKFFITLKADVLVMDMPDLETFHIKRSRVHPVHYVYVFHSMFSVHSYLRKGAVDHFDTIFCVGPHHIKEIRETERVYGLKPKKLIEYGYGRLDTLLEDVRNKQILTDNKKQVLIAPSYGPHNILETVGSELVRTLLENQYRVVIRPHPITSKTSPQIINKLTNEFQKNPDFILEKDVSFYDSFFSSHCMISDWSGVALEFSFALQRPVIFIDVPKKINNPDFKDISCEPIEIKIRKEIGEVVNPNHIKTIPQVIESLYNNTENLKKRISEIRSKTVFNIGKAGSIGATHITQIANTKMK